MSVNSKHIESLFAAAIELAGEPRVAFLNRECNGDPELRGQLDALLNAHDRVNHHLDRPVVGYRELEPTRLAVANAVGTLIAGRYKLLEQIGDGGMGTVWMAEQKEPVKRLVAVKLIKAGMDSKAVLARFEAERQALALMDHPNIAKVYDAGTDEAGRPYFAMELVKGLPLTEYCDARKLSLDERLDLFVQICLAVQHAHQKAIIHRDLKPANVLVTEHDGKPVPKVIDFGLAKALNSSQMLTERTLHTAYGTVVGTPLYMAPEQVGINALDIDTRTDIYALGVILYELLTGTTPLEKARFKEAAWEEMKRLIREEEPPRPSTRLSSDKSLASLAASRQVDAARLPGLVRGELDWIVMKALEKDRSRRYETANGLSKDIQRFLKGDTVEACPPSFGYRLRKAYRRNKVSVLVGTAFISLILCAGITGVWLAIRAEKARQGEMAERKRAEAREAEANEQRALARSEQQRAEQERQRAEEEKRAAEAVRSFLQEDLIRQADVYSRTLDMPVFDDGVAFKFNPTLHELLDRAAAQLTPEKIETRFPNMPFVQAEVLHSLSAAYSGIAQDEKSLEYVNRAIPLYLAARGPVDHGTLRARYQQAMQYYFLGRLEQAESSLRSVADDLHRAFGPNDRTAFDAQINVGRSMAESGRAAEAVEYFRALAAAGESAFGKHDLLTLLAAGHVSYALRLDGKPAEALQAIEAVKKSTQELKVRPDHPLLLRAFSELAETYKAMGRMQDAKDVWQDHLDAFAQRGEPYHSTTWPSRHELAHLLDSQGEFEKALQLFEQNTAVTLGPQFALMSNNGARRMALKLGRDDEALAFARNGLAAIMAGQSPAFRNWWTGLARLELGDLLLKRKEYVEAEPLLVGAVADLVDFHDRRPSFDNGQLAVSAHRSLTSLYAATNRPAEAERIRNTLATLIARFKLAGGKPWDVFHTGDYETAAKMFQADADNARSAEDKSRAYHGLFLSEQKLGRLEDALKHAQAAVDVIVAARGPKHRSYLLGMARSALGGLYYELKQFSAAEPHLLAGSREVQDYADQIPTYNYAHRYTAFKQLISILNRSNRAEEAKTWEMEWQKLFEKLVQKTLARGKFTPATVPVVSQVVLAHVGSARHAEALAVYRDIEATYQPNDKAAADAWLKLSGTVFNRYEGRLQFDLLKPWAELRIPTLERNLDALRKSNPSEVALLRATNSLAFSYLYAGRKEDAVKLAEETIARQIANGWRTDKDSVNSYGSMVKAISLAGRANVAEQMSSEVLSALKNRKAAPTELAGATFSQGFARYHASRYADAEASFREAAQLLTETGQQDWTGTLYKTWLGFALHEQKKYADAEPLLASAYSQWEQQLDSAPEWDRHHPWLIARALARLNDALNKPEEAMKWKALGEPK